MRLTRMRIRFGTLLGVGLAALLAGCSARAAYQLPPITPAPMPVAEPGRFVWFELITDDPEAAQAFYSGLFGWEFAEPEEDVPYTLISSGGVPVAGMAALPPKEDPNEDDDEVPPRPAAWLPTMAVPDMDAQLRPIFNEGGMLQLGPLQVEGRGRLAIAVDPGGAMVALLQPVEGAPPESDQVPGRFLWAELWAEKPAQAIAFYEDWVGYRAVPAGRSEGPSYHLFAKGRTPRAGLAEIPVRGIKPNWLPYVQVADLEAAITQAQQLGGRLLLRDEDAAILLDPVDAAIGIQEWSGGAGG